MRRLGIGLITIILAACGGGDGNSTTVSCAFFDHDTSAGVTAGSFENVPAAADRNLNTFAEIRSIGSGFISAGGKQFDGGGNAGLFVTPPEGATSADMTVNTYFSNALVQTATGPALSVTDTHGRTPATDYVSFPTTLPFDEIELVFTSDGSGSYLVFEFCGDGSAE